MKRKIKQYFSNFSFVPATINYLLLRVDTLEKYRVFVRFDYYVRCNFFKPIFRYESVNWKNNYL